MKQRCLFLLIIFSLLFFTSNLFITNYAYSQEEEKNTEIKKVIVTGSGVTEEDAIKDLSVSAVQQVVGIYVVSDTYVKNFQVINDEIFTHSNGYVKGFDILNKTKESGIVKIQALVSVELGNLTKKLSELQIATKQISDTTKAISFDKFNSAKSFRELVHSVIINPMKENKNIWDIKIKDINVSDKTYKLNEFYHLKQGDEDKIKLGELIPVEISFYLSLNQDYFDAITNFLDNSSERIDESPPSLKNLKNFNICTFRFNGDNENLIKCYRLSSQNQNIYNKLISDFFYRDGEKNYELYFKLSLIDSNAKVLGTNQYKECFGFCPTICTENGNIISSIFIGDSDHKNHCYYFTTFIDYRYRYSMYEDKPTLIISPEKPELIKIVIYLNESDIKNLKDVEITTQFKKKE